MPLSEFSEFLDFLDVFDISYVEGIMHFEDIIVYDVVGVDWGEKSLWASKLSYFLESPTAGISLLVKWVSTAINSDPYIT